MSKVGQKPISIIEGTEITIDVDRVLVKGPKGELSYDIPRELDVQKQENTIIIARKRETKRHKSLHGLFRSLIANALHGVTKGWSKRLEIVGTGYNVKMQGKDLAFKLGFSHPVVFKEIEGLQYTTEGNNICMITGADKQLVGEIAQQIKMIRKPDPYKGKGIRYEGEYIKLKPGKKAKV
ncbi:50S ribosomal protein L6 [Candidatus Woesebacteria bacterium]|nr:50S ribosomal protein L6 [Candidatus Woesebacteria bacterium]